MLPITKDQIKIINVLLSQIGNSRGFKFEKLEKAELISSYCDNRTDTTTGLTLNEAKRLISDLKTQLNQPQESAGHKMKRHIIAMAHEMNWHKIHAVNSKTPIDMQRVNEWCINFGYLHKPLDKYDYWELPRLVTQFKKVYQSYLKGL